MHVHCQGPCCITKSILHVHVHVACSCQCCIPCQCFMSMAMSIYIYIEMLECLTVRHRVSPVQDWKKLTMPKPARYRTKLTQSGSFLVRYRTKIRDAGMPALVSSMPMPSYGNDPSWKFRIRKLYSFNASPHPVLYDKKLWNFLGWTLMIFFLLCRPTNESLRPTPAQMAGLGNDSLLLDRETLDSNSEPVLLQRWMIFFKLQPSLLKYPAASYICSK